MNLKKIIIFYPSFEKGGVEKIIVNLINFFLNKNYKIILISSRFKKYLIKKKKKKFHLINIKSSKNYFINNRILKSYLSFFKLGKVLKNCSNQNTIVFSLQSSILAIIVSKFMNFKIVVRNAEDPINSAIHAENKIFAFFILFLKMIFYNFADKIITNSKGSKISLQKFLFNKNIKSIYNPYIKKIYKNKNLKKQNIIFSAGRLTKQKDFKSLIYAFNIVNSHIPNYKMIIVGDGSLKNELDNLILKLKLKNKVKLLGWRNNLKKYYLKSKLFVLSSLYEGLGNVLLDAVNYNLPIVTTNCKSGPPEIVCYGKGGFLSPISNPKYLSKKILYALKNYKKSQNKANFAKKNVNRFLIEKNSLKYLNNIKENFYEKK